MRPRAVLYDLFFREPPGRFALGHLLGLATADESFADLLQHKEAAHWHCDIANQDALTWSEKVYEIFGLPLGAPITREEAVQRYRDHSRGVLERVRSFATSHKCGFLLDAEISPRNEESRWIRIAALPILEEGRLVGLRGAKRVIDRPTTPPKSNQIRRGQRSKTYDLYLLDPDSRVALGWHKFDAASDKAAIELAQPLITQPPVELWQAEKLVRTWEPER
jgi:hypothetical protein